MKIVYSILYSIAAINRPFTFRHICACLSLLCNLWLKYCQRPNWPKALSTMTYSTPLVQSRSFNKLWNLGKTYTLFCLAKGEVWWEVNCEPAGAANISPPNARQRRHDHWPPPRCWLLAPKNGWHWVISDSIWNVKLLNRNKYFMDLTFFHLRSAGHIF